MGQGGQYCSLCRYCHSAIILREGKRNQWVITDSGIDAEDVDRGLIPKLPHPPRYLMEKKSAKLPQ